MHTSLARAARSWASDFSACTARTVGCIALTLPLHFKSAAHCYIVPLNHHDVNSCKHRSTKTLKNSPLAGYRAVRAGSAIGVDYTCSAKSLYPFRLRLLCLCMQCPELLIAAGCCLPTCTSSFLQAVPRSGRTSCWPCCDGEWSCAARQCHMQHACVNKHVPVTWHKQLSSDALCHIATHPAPATGRLPHAAMDECCLSSTPLNRNQLCLEGMPMVKGSFMQDTAMCCQFVLGGV